jgi:hypothetical protein
MQSYIPVPITPSVCRRPVEPARDRSSGRGKAERAVMSCRVSKQQRGCESPSGFETAAVPCMRRCVGRAAFPCCSMRVCIPLARIWSGGIYDSWLCTGPVRIDAAVLVDIRRMDSTPSIRRVPLFSLGSPFRTRFHVCPPIQRAVVLGSPFPVDAWRLRERI